LVSQQEDIVRVLWTLLKVVIALALVVPISIIVLTTALGVLGALFGLAVVVLRIAVVGVIAWGAFRLITRLMRAPTAPSAPRQIADARPADPYYDAALRELDRDLA
jgi:hypothetical protein